MGLIKTFVFCLFLTSALTVNAVSSFRMSDGKLITVGLSKSELIAHAGEPLYTDVETIAVDDGKPGKPIKREILTFRLDASIGGPSLVVVTVENSTVISIDSKQESRK